VEKLEKVVHRKKSRATIEGTLVSEDCGAIIVFFSGFSSCLPYHSYAISCSTLPECSEGTMAYQLFTYSADPGTTLLFGKDNL
jgi:hypothetical protein